MKIKKLISLVIIWLVYLVSSNTLIAQGQNVPWTPQQLLAPADLAQVLNNPKSPQPIIYSIGMEAIIKGSIDIGPVMMPQNLNTLKQKLGKLQKNAQIVVYCGCCPFSRCPNVRPAMQLLKEMQFTNYSLLNLPQNIKVDWIDKGYPMTE